MSLNDIEVEVFTKPDKLQIALKKIHQGAVITEGSFVSDVPGYINDLEWNFYDEVHRYHVHNTYHDMFKVFSGKTFSVNVVKWGNFPFFIQVANAKVSNNVFYQSMSILGIFYIHQIMTLEQIERKVRLSRQWYNVSHWLFRPLHGFLNKKLMALQIKQDIEDNEHIRSRRLELRDRGFHFTTDKANFTNSNTLTNNVIFPSSDIEARIRIADIVSDDMPKYLKLGELELIVKREGKVVTVWPGICPHEGARLICKDIQNDIAQCQWHGRRFKGNQLVDNGLHWSFLDFRVSMENGELVARSVKKSLLKTK